MNLTSLLSRLFDPHAPRNGAVSEALEMRKEAAEGKAQAATELRDVLGEFIHGINSLKQNEIARRGE